MGVGLGFRTKVFQGEPSSTILRFLLGVEVLQQSLRAEGEAMDGDGCREERNVRWPLLGGVVLGRSPTPIMAQLLQHRLVHDHKLKAFSFFAFNLPAKMTMQIDWENWSSKLGLWVLIKGHMQYVVTWASIKHGWEFGTLRWTSSTYICVIFRKKNLYFLMRKSSLCGK